MTALSIRPPRLHFLHLGNQLTSGLHSRDLVGPRIPASNQNAPTKETLCDDPPYSNFVYFPDHFWRGYPRLRTRSQPITRPSIRTKDHGSLSQLPGPPVGRGSASPGT